MLRKGYNWVNIEEKSRMKPNGNRELALEETKEVIELIKNSAAFQLNGSAEEISKALENLPPETIGEIMDATPFMFLKIDVNSLVFAP